MDLLCDFHITTVNQAAVGSQSPPHTIQADIASTAIDQSDCNPLPMQMLVKLLQLTLDLHFLTAYLHSDIKMTHFSFY